MRNAEIGNKDFELDVLEEAYTTEHWLVRIYKVWHQNKPRPHQFGEKKHGILPNVFSFTAQVKDLDNRGLSRT